MKIVALAHKKNTLVEYLPPSSMPPSRSGKGREVIAAFVEPSNIYTLDNLINRLYDTNQAPFLLLMNRVSYDNNIGMIARSAYAAGVNGLIFQGQERDFVNDESVHVSIGALLRIPLVKMSIFPALDMCKENSIPTYVLDMEGETYFTEQLAGPLALVLGSEGEGISDTVTNRCDKKIAIPMQPGIDSLNVAISASIVLFEKARQEMLK